MRLFSLCVLCCLPLQPLWAQSFCSSSLRVGFDDWPPYHYYQQEGARRELRGFAVDYLNAVSNRLGCHLVYVERPWKRGLHEDVYKRQKYDRANCRAANGAGRPFPAAAGGGPESLLEEGLARYKPAGDELSRP